VTRGTPASEFQPERTARQQLGTMGGGNHFCELCLDEHGDVWLVLHSGSRGAGNRIGTTYIEIAQRELQDRGVTLADRDLAYLNEHTPSFDAYVEAVGWAQEYARLNRELMLERALEALAHRNVGLPHFARGTTVVNCHHNYVARERHYGADVFVTRKGAVRAGVDRVLRARRVSGKTLPTSRMSGAFLHTGRYDPRA
jgi:tRNA-splicing ligase RtcB